MTKKSNKRALLMSVLSLLLCCAMLVGSTFAWFSDEAKSGVNKITAGNLDVELQYNKNSGNKEVGAEWADAKETPLFDEDTLWEPGKMMVSKEFKVINKGNLALVYRLAAETVGAEVTGKEDRSLTEVIKMAVVSSTELTEAIEAAGVTTEADEKKLTPTQREDIWNNLTESGKNAHPVGSYSADFELESGESEVKVIVLYWKPADSTAVDPEDNIDNYFNVPTDVATTNYPSISFSLSVFATQMPHEEDSYGKDYDAGVLEAYEISGAFKTGITGLSDQIKAVLTSKGIAGFDEAITISTPEVAEDGSISAKMEFGNAFTSGTSKEENSCKALGQAFVTCADSITDILYAEKDNISTITINGNAEGSAPVDFAGIRAKEEAEGKKELGRSLYSALLSAIVQDGLGSEGKTVALTVDVVSAHGASTTYTLTFDFSKSDILNGNLGNYAAAIFEAIGTAHPDWED